MQDKIERRPNSVRRAEMRDRLIAKARDLFVEKGYAETSTPEIVRAAEVTRGALYHHFADKAALFDAVVAAEAEAVGVEIAVATRNISAETAMSRGTEAWFGAMAAPGRARLLLIDGPAVLGWARMDQIDAGGGRAQLLEGLRAQRPGRSAAEIDALAAVLSAAYDRAALAVANGADTQIYSEVMRALVAQTD